MSSTSEPRDYNPPEMEPEPVPAPNVDPADDASMLGVAHPVHGEWLLTPFGRMVVIAAEKWPFDARYRLSFLRYNGYADCTMQRLVDAEYALDMLRAEGHLR